jgi:hypothetical protein
VLLSRTELRPRWLSRYGVWVRRSLLAVAIAIPFVAKASGIPQNSQTAKAWFFVALLLGIISLVFYAVEYLLAVRRRGYWLDHHFD